MLAEKNKMYNLYLNAYANTAKNYKPGTAVQKESLYKLIFYSVKAANSRPKDEYMTLDQAEKHMEFNLVATNAIGLLTPRELLNIFPLAKKYDGEKWETKDYFYSMNYIKEHGLDNPIGDCIDFLWEYTNWETNIFVVNTLSLMDRIQNMRGYPSAFDEFMEDQGIETLTKYTDSKGQDFFLNDEGNVIKPKKLYPRYLRLIRQ